MRRMSPFSQKSVEGLCYSSMKNHSLQQFIAHARQKGMDHQTIRMLLLSAGWKDRQVLEAMSEESLDMPLPMPDDRGGAREAFFHLLAFASLYTSVVSVLVLLFQYLNKLFPDVAFDNMYFGDDGTQSMIRWFLAMLIVSFPLFVWISRIINGEISASPERAWSPVRRWLTYLTLFITAGVLVGDLITLLFYLLEGEISIRFILKVLVVLAVAGMVFSYYFLALKLPPNHSQTKQLHQGFSITAWVVVIGVIVWGMFFAGTPLGQRMKRLDDVRVQNLRDIQNEIYNIAYEGTDRYSNGRPFTSLPHPLPTTLEEVVQRAQYQRPTITDPETNEQYDYAQAFIGDVPSTFELCATFDTVRDLDYDIFWNHPAGHHCYRFNALDPATK